MLELILVVERLEEGLWFLSSLKTEFSKETKIMKKIKVFIRSKVHMAEQQRLHTIGAA